MWNENNLSSSLSTPLNDGVRSNESRRLSRDLNNILRPSTTADSFSVDLLSSYSTSQRPKHDGISAGPRTTGTSYSGPTSTSSIRTTLTTSSRPTLTSSTRTTVTPVTKPTGAHTTRPTGAPYTRTAAMSAYTKAAVSYRLSSIMNTLDSLINVNKPTPSARSKGIAGDEYCYSSSGSVATSDSHHNVTCKLEDYKSYKENAGARPKQYKESRRLSRDLDNILRLSTTADSFSVDLLSSHSTSQRPKHDGISAGPRTTGTSYSGPTSTSSIRTTLPTSTRPTLTSSTRTTVTPVTKPTGAHSTRPTGAPYTRTAAMSAYTKAAASYSSSSTINTLNSLINVNKPTPSSRSKGIAGDEYGYSSSGSVATSDSHHNVTCKLEDYKSYKENAGARPKQYKESQRLSKDTHNGCRHTTTADRFNVDLLSSHSSSQWPTHVGISSGSRTTGTSYSGPPFNDDLAELHYEVGATVLRHREVLGSIPCQGKPKVHMDSAVKPKESTARNTSSASVSILPGCKPSATSSTKKTSKKGVIVKTMRDNLLCPICLDLLENAKTLSCQHVVCKECLEQWVASRGELRCPTCNTIQKKPFGGVNGLPSNFMLNNLAAEMKKLDTHETETGIFEEWEEEEEVSGTLLAAALSTTDSVVHFTYGNTSWKNIPVAGTSFLEILGNQCKVKGSTVKLKLQFCNVHGQPIRGKSSDGIKAVVVHPDGENISILDVLFRKRTGDFTVSFEAEQIGIHLAEVTMKGESVVGSPLKIVVRPNVIMARTLWPIWHAPNGILATSSYVYVTDKSGKVYIQQCWHIDGYYVGADKPDHKEGIYISPFGIAKCNDKLFITDSYNSCVYVYVHMACTNNFGKRILEKPTGIAVSNDGTIYIADSDANIIDVFLPNYSHKGSIDVKGKGSLKHLALNQSEDRIIVADDKTNVIKIIDIKRKKMVKSIKTRISRTPANPFGVALDDEDNIYVSVTFDPSKLTKRRETARNVRRKGAVIVYNSDGYFLGTIGEKELINPRGICFINEHDTSPQLLVVDGSDSESRYGCIKVFRL
ncbi:uncharacterized protein [Apostichopus japonicus]|uniref:uncharacterized protein n=1 Tax=Stichopus japonicus TaxID=307972 RepID=UPI003AB21AF5